MYRNDDDGALWVSEAVQVRARVVAAARARALRFVAPQRRTSEPRRSIASHVAWRFRSPPRRTCGRRRYDAARAGGVGLTRRGRRGTKRDVSVGVCVCLCVRLRARGACSPPPLAVRHTGGGGRDSARVRVCSSPREGSWCASFVMSCTVM